MSTPTPPLLAKFLSDVTAHKKALWEMKVSLWNTRKFERTSWRTLHTNAGISESTARNYYAEVEASMNNPETSPDYQVIDLNALPAELSEQVRAHLEKLK